MDWINLEELDQIGEINKTSEQQFVLIYKHSTRCGISSAALKRLESESFAHTGSSLKHYFLDLLRHRDISMAIADRYGVRHESPQVLLIRNGQCVYHSSHSAISYETLIKKMV